MPQDVRCHPALTYWWRNPDGEPVQLGTFPALVSLIRSIDGRVRGLDRTYLQPDGRGKACLFEDGERVQPPAKKAVAVSDGATRGCAVHLFPMSAAGVLAIAEGIETALAVMTLWGVPCWSVLSASNLERFELPPGIQEIVIFTDADENGAGQYAGKVLARRVLAMESPQTVRIATPTEIGTDWLDYLNSIALEEVSHG